MLPHRDHASPSFQRIQRSRIDQILQIELDPVQVESFLGPMDDILTAVRHGLTHGMVGIHVDGLLIGFWVLHRDPRDAAVWWLGWFAMDHRQQGRGYGRQAMAAIMQAFQKLPGCRQARLLVSPLNLGAKRLYEAWGFRQIGIHPVTGELIMECRVASGFPGSDLASCPPPTMAARVRRARRGPRLEAGPHAVRMVGVERGPP